MSDRAEDKEVSTLVSSDRNRKSEENRKMKPRSPSQSPTTIQRTDNFFPTLEDREKWRMNSSKWLNDIEDGFFSKVEKQFEASINGCGLENGIELDTSGSADEDHSSGSINSSHVHADPAAVAAEYWQEVSAKANLVNSRVTASSVNNSGGHGDHAASAGRPNSLDERSTSNSPASSLRSGDLTLQPQISR